jgi:hypothetical protein
MKVRIRQPYSKTFFHQGNSQVGGYSTFADPAFVTTDNKLMLDVIHPMVDKPAVVLVFVGFAVRIIIKLTHLTCVKESTISSNYHLNLLKKYIMGRQLLI